MMGAWSTSGTDRRRRPERLLRGRRARRRRRDRRGRCDHGVPARSTPTGTRAVVATRDWHAPLPDTNDGHFAVGAEPDYVTTWPVHCVAGTRGAEYHPDLLLPAGTRAVRKGEGRQDYSGFEGEVVDGGRSPAGRGPRRGGCDRRRRRRPGHGPLRGGDRVGRPCGRVRHDRAARPHGRRGLPTTLRAVARLSEQGVALRTS